VGYQAITVNDLRLLIGRNGYDVFAPGSAKQALDDAIAFEILAGEAKRVGVDRDPQLARQIKELLVERLLAEKVDAGLRTNAPTEEELEKFFAAHPDDYARPGVDRGLILSLLTQPGKEAETEAKASQVLAALTKGERFDALVRQFSDEPSERSNLVGTWFSEGKSSRRYPAEVVTALAALKQAGDHAGPIKTPRAFYFIALAERRERQAPSFEQVRAEVTRRFLQEQRRRAVEAYVAGLRKEAIISVNEANLSQAVEPVQAGGPPPRGPVGNP